MAKFKIKVCALTCSDKEGITILSKKEADIGETSINLERRQQIDNKDVISNPTELDMTYIEGYKDVDDNLAPAKEVEKKKKELDGYDDPIF